MQLWEWCLDHQIQLEAKYLPGVDNRIADKESRTIRHHCNFPWRPMIRLPFFGIVVSPPLAPLLLSPLACKWQWNKGAIWTACFAALVIPTNAANSWTEVIGFFASCEASWQIFWIFPVEVKLSFALLISDDPEILFPALVTIATSRCWLSDPMQQTDPVLNLPASAAPPGIWTPLTVSVVQVDYQSHSFLPQKSHYWFH